MMITPLGLREALLHKPLNLIISLPSISLSEIPSMAPLNPWASPYNPLHLLPPFQYLHPSPLPPSTHLEPYVTTICLSPLPPPPCFCISPTSTQPYIATEEFFPQCKPLVLVEKTEGRNPRLYEDGRSGELGRSSDGFPPRRRLFLQRSWAKRNKRGGDCRFPEEEDHLAGENSGKTTVMIRHLPNKLTKDQLRELLDNHCREENKSFSTGNSSAMSEYDFLYLPIDFSTGNNRGFAFVNFTTDAAARRLQGHLQGRTWLEFGSRKVCGVTYARFQGLDALMDHLKDKVFPCDSVEYLPARYTPSRNGLCRTDEQYIGRHVPR